MFGASLLKQDAASILDGLVKQLELLDHHIKRGDSEKALAITAEIKQALEKVRPWLTK